VLVFEIDIVYVKGKVLFLVTDMRKLSADRS
jgi:hypothetical protein